jgi:hypothetical protein
LANWSVARYAAATELSANLLREWLVAALDILVEEFDLRPVRGAV